MVEAEINNEGDNGYKANRTTIQMGPSGMKSGTILSILFMLGIKKDGI